MEGREGGDRLTHTEREGGRREREGGGRMCMGVCVYIRMV